MTEREKISRYFAAMGHRDVAERLLDLAMQVRKGRPYAVSDFYNPVAGQIATTIRGHYPELEAKEFGGYPGAERSKIGFCMGNTEHLIDWQVGAVKIMWDARYRLIGHRDVLGSLIGLGLEREVFGDIIMQSAAAQVIVDKQLVDYLCREMTKVAMVGVTVEPLVLSEVVPREEKTKTVRTTVASLRLDAIGASGFGISRTKMVAAIESERVQVNWQRAKGPAQVVAVGDVISFRGRGRMVVVEITGISRKGRTGVVLERYI